MDEFFKYLGGSFAISQLIAVILFLISKMDFQKITPIYKNPQLFLIVTFGIIPSLFYPASYLSQHWFLAFAIEPIDSVLKYIDIISRLL